MNFSIHYWKDVLPFFKKAERWTGPTANSSYGTGGRHGIMPDPIIPKVINTGFVAVRLNIINITYCIKFSCHIKHMISYFPRVVL